MQAARELMDAECRALGLPGMATAMLGADGQAGSAYTSTQCNDHTLFEIGSISKSLVALAIHRLIDTGTLQLDTAVQKILPDYPLPAASISIVQLLDHSSGLPEGTPLFPNVPGGSLWTGFSPGERFSYSNTGYVLLGAVLEKLTGKHFAQSLQQLALDPLGMKSSVPVLRVADRPRFPTGYMLADPRRLAYPHAQLAPAPNVEMDDPAGSVGATMPDMARYIAFLAAAVNGQSNKVLSPRATRDFAMRQGVPDPDIAPDARYASGLIHRMLDGRKVIEHTGGMFGFTASMTIDILAGTGCFAGTNVKLGSYRPRRISRLLCRRLAGQDDGQQSKVGRHFGLQDDSPLLGRWIAATGEVVEITPQYCLYNGQAASVWIDGGMLVTDHVDLAEWPIEKHGESLWWRDRQFARQRPETQGSVDRQLGAFEGVYANNDPWYVEGVAVIARDDGLHIVGRGKIMAEADGSWRFADPAAATERVWFGPRVTGRPQSISVSGISYRRVAHRQDW